MTGFGVASRTWNTPRGEPLSVDVEIRTVNSRFRELKLRQPYGPVVEAELRRRIEAEIGRGRVDVLIQSRLDFAGSPSGEAGSDSALDALGLHPADVLRLVQAVREAERISSQAGLELAPPTSVELFRFLASSRVTSQGVPTPPPFLDELVQQALEGVLTMRAREGAVLVSALVEQRQALAEACGRLRAIIGREPERWDLRVREWLATHLQGTDRLLDANRIEQEVALLLLKGDVTEELARIESHLGQLDEVLASTAHSGQGKTLDFLCQELFREISTVGSKLGVYEGRALVVELKTLVERIREQVQNIE